MMISASSGVWGLVAGGWSQQAVVPLFWCRGSVCQLCLPVLRRRLVVERHPSHSLVASMSCHCDRALDGPHVYLHLSLDRLCECWPATVWVFSHAGSPPQLPTAGEEHVAEPQRPPSDQGLRGSSPGACGVWHGLCQTGLP